MSRRLALLLVLVLAVPAFDAPGLPEDVRKLEKKLGDRDPGVRAQAAWDLGEAGAPESVPALTRALEDSSFAVRANAAASLGKLGAASRPAIPALKRLLEDESAAAVGNAAGALRKLGVPVDELLPAYRRLLSRHDCESRVVGLKGLLDDAPPGELFDAAWDCAEAPDVESDTRSDAREALRKIVGGRTRTLVPRILDTLRHLGTRDGSDLVLAVASLDPPVAEAVPVLVSLLDVRHDTTRRYAASGLGRMGEAALPAAPRLVEVLKSASDPQTREKAAEALGDLGEKAAPVAVPALAAAARDDSWPKVRYAALTALGEMREAAKEAVPVLRAALKDPDGWISVAARNALFRVEPDRKEEVSAIADAARPVQKGSLFDDLARLKEVLPQRVPEVYELAVYDTSASATAPCRDVPGGRCRFQYEAGAVTGPDEGSGDCEKRIALSGVDFSVVPGLVRQAPSLLGAPSGKVELVQLGPGVFCKAFGWYVHVKGAGMVEFKLNGKPGKVLKY